MWSSNKVEVGGEMLVGKSQKLSGFDAVHNENDQLREVINTPGYFIPFFSIIFFIFRAKQAEKWYFLIAGVPFRFFFVSYHCCSLPLQFSWFFFFCCRFCFSLIPGCAPPTLSNSNHFGFEPYWIVCSYSASRRWAAFSSPSFFQVTVGKFRYVAVCVYNICN